MSLSKDAKEIMVVGLANRKLAIEISTAMDAGSALGAVNAAGIAANVADIATNVADIGTNVTAIGLNTTHSASAGVDHSDVVLNNAARNVDWRIVGMMVAANANVDTDAATLGTLVGDFVQEIDQAGNASTASGVVAIINEFLASATEITQVIADTRTNSVDGDYFDITAKSGALYRVYLDTTGADAVIPAAGGRVLTRVDISGGADTAANCGDLVAGVMDALGDFGAPATGTGTILITDANAGIVVDAVDPGMNLLWAVTTDTQGASGPAAAGNLLVHYRPI